MVDRRRILGRNGEKPECSGIKKAGDSNANTPADAVKKRKRQEEMKNKHEQKDVQKHHHAGDNEDE